MSGPGVILGRVPADATRTCEGPKTSSCLWATTRVGPEPG